MEKYLADQVHARHHVVQCLDAEIANRLHSPGQQVVLLKLQKRFINLQYDYKQRVRFCMLKDPTVSDSGIPAGLLNLLFAATWNARCSCNPQHGAILLCLWRRIGWLVRLKATSMRIMFLKQFLQWQQKSAVAGTYSDLCNWTCWVDPALTDS